ncbi:DUF4183 domain-containing protein [Cohnella sp. AR92]|uniref:DUF4183 domain-containing protein n=1 Tax=Cohnella sp. AR92 TaxID=648716 RepID=UPI002100FFD3|nr:DUF4183 domain-containing protein [Cohnella sp. AR92]
MARSRKKKCCLQRQIKRRKNQRSKRSCWPRKHRFCPKAREVRLILLLIRVRPIVRRYFHIASSDLDLASGQVLEASLFVGDNGEAVQEFSNINQEGYVNLFVNGIMQEGEMYHVDANGLLFAAADQQIAAGSTIIIESVGFKMELSHN